MFQLCLVVTILGVTVASPSPKHEGIIGGVSIDISQAPHQVSLARLTHTGGYFHMCGGTIVGVNLIISAAHCFTDLSPSNWRVRAGSSSSQYGGELYEIQRLLIHPEYVPPSFDKDIAVIWLSKPLQFSNNVQTIGVLSAGEEIPIGQEVIVTGWGWTAEGGSAPPPTSLQMIKIPLLGSEACKQVFGQTFTSNMLCAGAAGKNSCRGDSGGPLVYGNRLAGVVSFGGHICGNSPAGYTKISALRPWLDSVTN